MNLQELQQHFDNLTSIRDGLNRQITNQSANLSGLRVEHARVSEELNDTLAKINRLSKPVNYDLLSDNNA